MTAAAAMIVTALAGCTATPAPARSEPRGSTSSSGASASSTPPALATPTGATTDETSLPAGVRPTLSPTADPAGLQVLRVEPQDAARGGHDVFDGTSLWRLSVGGTWGDEKVMVSRAGTPAGDWETVFTTSFDGNADIAVGGGRAIVAMTTSEAEDYEVWVIDGDSSSYLVDEMPDVDGGQHHPEVAVTGDVGVWTGLDADGRHCINIWDLPARRLTTQRCAAGVTYSMGLSGTTLTWMDETPGTDGPCQHTYVIDIALGDDVAELPTPSCHLRTASATSEFAVWIEGGDATYEAIGYDRRTGTQVRLGDAHPASLTPCGGSIYWLSDVHGERRVLTWSPEGGLRNLLTRDRMASTWPTWLECADGHLASTLHDEIGHGDDVLVDLDV